MLKLMSVVVSTNNRLTGGVPHMLIDIINYPDFNIRTWEYESVKETIKNQFTDNNVTHIPVSHFSIQRRKSYLMPLLLAFQSELILSRKEYQ